MGNQPTQPRDDTRFDELQRKGDSANLNAGEAVEYARLKDQQDNRNGAPEDRPQK